MKKTVLRRLCKYLPSARDLMPDDEDEPPTLNCRPRRNCASIGKTTSLAAKSVTPTAASEANGGAQDQADEPPSSTGNPSAVDDDPAATDALVREHAGHLPTV